MILHYVQVVGLITSSYSIVACLDIIRHF